MVAQQAHTEKYNENYCYYPSVKEMGGDGGADSYKYVGAVMVIEEG